MSIKQNLARKHNWNKALLLGNIGSLIRVCNDLKAPNTVKELVIIQKHLLGLNQEVYKNRKELLN